MKNILRFSPPHSIFTISDPKASDGPVGEDRDVRIWVTSDTIGMACFPSDDGETELYVSTLSDDAPAESPRVDVQLPTPNRAIVFEQSDLTEVMRVDVLDAITRVRIWSNDPQFPDKILIVIG